MARQYIVREAALLDLVAEVLPPPPSPGCSGHRHPAPPPRRAACLAPRLDIAVAGAFLGSLVSAWRLQRAAVVPPAGALMPGASSGAV